MKHTILLVIAFVVIFLFVSEMAFADRFVVINGELQNSEHVDTFEKTCGPIPDGFYRVDWSSGDWGYPGDWAPRGNLNDICSMNDKRESANLPDLRENPKACLTPMTYVQNLN